MNTWKIYPVLVVSVLAMVACGRDTSRPSMVSLSFPRISSQQKVGKQGEVFPTGKTFCFAVNVTGPGIDNEVRTCAPIFGAKAGFVPEGGTISFEVPRGPGRQFDVYMLVKPLGSTCPAIDGNEQINPASVYQVASISNVDTSRDETVLKITISYPGDANTLASQLNMPASCLVAATPTPSVTPAANQFRIGVGGGFATSSSYKINAQIGSSVSRQTGTTATGVKLYAK